MADGLTLDDIRRMQELEAELMRLREIQEAMSPEERAMLFEDSDMDEAMLYAEQDRDLRRDAQMGDPMANAILSDDVPSPQEMDPNTRTFRRMEFPPGFLEEMDAAQDATANRKTMQAVEKIMPMRMDGMGAGPMPQRALPKETMDYTLEDRAPLFEKELGLSYQDMARMPSLPMERRDVPQKKKAEEADDE
jgi:hypothetical protein